MFDEILRALFQSHVWPPYCQAVAWQQRRPGAWRVTGRAGRFPLITGWEFGSMDSGAAHHDGFSDSGDLHAALIYRADQRRACVIDEVTVIRGRKHQQVGAHAGLDATDLVCEAEADRRVVGRAAQRLGR